MASPDSTLIGLDADMEKNKWQEAKNWETVKQLITTNIFNFLMIIAFKGTLWYISFRYNIKIKTCGNFI